MSSWGGGLGNIDPLALWLLRPLRHKFCLNKRHQTILNKRHQNKSHQTIPHICHLLYTGRIFKFQILHLKITKIYPKTRKYVIFLRSIWKNLHLTEFFTRAAPVVPVTIMRYGLAIASNDLQKSQ